MSQKYFNQMSLELLFFMAIWLQIDELCILFGMTYLYNNLHSQKIPMIRMLFLNFNMHDHLITVYCMFMSLYFHTHIQRKKKKSNLHFATINSVKKVIFK